MAQVRRIVVIHPPQEVERDYIDYPYFTGIAAMSTATALARAGHDVHLLDAFGLPGAGFFHLRDGRGAFGVPYAALWEPLAQAEFDAAVVHLTPYALGSGFSQGLANLLSRMRRGRPGAMILGAELFTGGTHRIPPSPDLLRRWYPELDGFVSLEAEETIPEIVGAGSPAGFAVEGRPVSRETLDSLVPPCWEPLAAEAFKRFLAALKGGPKLAEYGVDERSLPVFFSRGCPFSCTFCSNPYQNYRPLTLARAIDLMAWARRLGFDRLCLLDDVANARRDFLDLLEAVAQAGFRLALPNGLRADLLSQEAVGMLARLTDRLTVSAESASPRVQKDAIRKSVTVEQVEQVAAWAAQARLPLSIHWMTGIPGETRPEARQTLMAARRLLDEYGAVPLIQFATPIPATSASPRFDSAQGRRGGGESEAGGRGISSPLSSLGDRIQHAPSFLPESVGKEELQTAVGLLRRRAGQAACAKVIVNLTYRCNNHCLFCAVGNRLKEDLPLVNVREVLEKYRAQGIRQLDLDGGEPTLHPDLLEIIALAVRMGFAPINVTTNGRRLSYPDFARALLGSGIHSLLVSLHGPNSRVHERLTGAPGSFRETMAGIRNALAYRPASVDVGVNTTLSVENYALVEQLVEILFPLGVERFNLQFLTPFGRAAAEAVPKPEEAAAVVRSLIEKWKGRVRIQVINLPYCLLAGREDFLVPDLGKLSRNMVFVTRQEVNLYHYLAQCRKYDEKCASCLFAVACDGQYDFSEVQA